LIETHSKLETFVRRKLIRWDIDLSDGEDVGATLIRELTASIVPSGDQVSWQRRPSISADGTPVILSWKIGRVGGDELRLLVEPGSLGMTVAQQIAFSLTRLDSLLGLLDWRNAVEDINAITTQVFPSDPASTREWWGGIWFGANVLPSDGGSSHADLRLYLNMRHGDAAERWRRLVAVVSSFVSPSLEPVLGKWLTIVSQHAIPVGLGVVVAAGRVCAIRAYVGVYNPTPASLLALSSLFIATDPRELAEAHNSFTARFGSMQPQAVTVGYDFIRDMHGDFPMAIGRVKIDICCHLIAQERRSILIQWITQLLAAWSFESSSLATFLDDIHTVWSGSEIQFLSLGFSSSLDHVTIYVKPCT
jgi:hypothetical protein